MSGAAGMNWAIVIFEFVIMAATANFDLQAKRTYEETGGIS